MATKRPRKKLNSKNCQSDENETVTCSPMRRSQRSSMVERRAKKKKREVLVCEEDIVQQWLTLGTAKDLSSDADIARFLLSLYFNEKQKETPSTDHCTRCHAPLVLRCDVCQLSFPHGRPPPLQSKSQTCAQPQDLPSSVPPSVKKEQSTAVLPVVKERRKTRQCSFPPVSKGERKTTQPASLRKQPSLSEDQVNTESETLAENPTGNGVGSFGTEEREAVEKFNEGLSASVPESSSNGNRNTFSSEKTGIALKGECLDGVQVVEDSLAVSSGGVEILAPVTCEGDEEHVDGFEDIDDDDDGGDDDCDDDGGDDDGGKDKEKKPKSKSRVRRKFREYLCPYCPLVLKSPEHKPHVQTHTSTMDAFTCHVCTKTFLNFRSFYKHLKFSTDQTHCKECDHVFTARCQIYKHAKHHQMTRARFCKTCDQSFLSMNKNDFDRHVNKHAETDSGELVGMALCPVCGKVIKRYDLKKHLTYHNKDDPFPCGVCDKAFKNKSSLRQHELFHGEKTQQCEICGTKYFIKSQLKRHMQKHFGKQHACEECSRQFYSKMELKDHVRAVHRGICPFPCNLCNKKFYQHGNLKIHLRTHTGEKPYHCDQCPSKFGSKDALQKHERRHTGEKPFSCEDCGKMYSCHHSYKTHRKKYHSDSVYTCQDCYQVFPVRTSLKFHRKMCHFEKLFEVNPSVGSVELEGNVSVGVSV